MRELFRREIYMIHVYRHLTRTTDWVCLYCNNVGSLIRGRSMLFHRKLLIVGLIQFDPDTNNYAFAFLLFSANQIKKRCIFSIVYFPLYNFNCKIDMHVFQSLFFLNLSKRCRF